MREDAAQFDFPGLGRLQLDLLGLVGGDTLGTLGAIQIALQDKIRALPGTFTGSLLDEELLAQGAATEAVDGLHIVEDLIALLAQLGKVCFHAAILYLYRYNIKAKSACRLSGLEIGYFGVTHPNSTRNGNET